MQIYTIRLLLIICINKYFNGYHIHQKEVAGTKQNDVLTNVRETVGSGLHFHRSNITKGVASSAPPQIYSPLNLVINTYLVPIKN